MFSMKATEIPKGVKFSFLIMSTPLFLLSTYLAILAPVATLSSTFDPAGFAYLARSCVRFLALNISFIVSP